VTSIVAFIFVLGVLIFVHELGHFLMARRIGVRVLTFSLGFGPKLLSFRRGDTEYCISAIPLGGYVKMAGETSEESRTGAPDEFLSKTKWQRFQVLVMGPVMNLVLAVAVMAGVIYQGAQLPAFEDSPVVIGGFLPNSVGQAAGLQAGDRLISVEGRPVPIWKQYYLTIATRTGRTTRLEIERNGQIIHREVVPKAIDKYGTGDIGLLPIMRPQIGAVRPNEPAVEGGLRPGDRVLKANDEAGVSRERLIELIKSHEGRPLKFEVAREDGRLESLTVVPRKIDGAVLIGATIYPMELRSVNPGALESVKLSLQRNWETGSMIFETIRGLFTRETSVKQLMGPVAIAGLSGEAAQDRSWIPLFQLMAMLSLNLGILNLMPIPVLDGGHITILALESVSRRDFSIKVKEKMLLAGFVLLMMLMVTVIYNDLMRIQWIERLVPWR
jgi:regulator of sigma E protease